MACVDVFFFALRGPRNVSNDEEHSFDNCFSITRVVEGETRCYNGGGIFSFGVSEIYNGINICASGNRLLIEVG